MPVHPVPALGSQHLHAAPRLQHTPPPGHLPVHPPVGLLHPGHTLLSLPGTLLPSKATWALPGSAREARSCRQCQDVRWKGQGTSRQERGPASRCRKQPRRQAEGRGEAWPGRGCLEQLDCMVCPEREQTSAQQNTPGLTPSRGKTPTRQGSRLSWSPGSYHLLRGGGHGSQTQPRAHLG